MPSLEKIESLPAAYCSAAAQKDVEAMIALFDEECRIFDMWQVWVYKGLASWREMVKGWFTSLGPDRDVVTFREVRIEEEGDLGYLSAFVRYTAFSEKDEELRFLDNRLTWVLRRRGLSWKILHQHTSSPIDFNTMKVIFKDEGI